MSSIVDRVRKLVALSGSPNENEGRTAASLACRLIREHALEVRDPAPGARRVERPAERPRRRATRGPYTRERDLRGAPRCCECSEPISSDDGFLDGDGLPVHGDCIPGGERP
jgi:hypothetical protein